MKYLLSFAAYSIAMATSAFAYEVVNTVGVNEPRKSEFELMIENPQFWVLIGVAVVLLLVISNKSASSKKKSGE